MPIAELSGFLGANLKVPARFLPEGVGTVSLNQKPNERGQLVPWRIPLAIAGPVTSALWKTLYRMDRDAATPAQHWLGWNTVVHAIRGFDPDDPTERTYFTGSGSPKWTDNVMGLASAPYPAAARLLGVPQPTQPPTVTLSADGSTGEAHPSYYVYTRVNDIGWESAPSPPVLGPSVKPGAVLDLGIVEALPGGNYGVDRMRWYRSQPIAGTDDAIFQFLREYTAGATGMQDDGRVTVGTMASEAWLELDAVAFALTTCWNSFAAALVGKSVRFCEPDVIYAWPLAYEYTTDSTPIAQAAFAQRLLVLTSAGAELFTGTHPAEMDRKPLALAPIVSPRSLVVGETFCGWAAADGLWYYGTDGYRCLTGECLKPAQWAALAPQTMACYLLQEGDRTCIVGFYNDGALKGFVIDPSNPGGIYFLATGYSAGFWDPLLRALFVLDGSTIKQWDAGGSFMTATARSKAFRQMAVTEAEWIELLDVSGTAQVKVWTDDPATEGAQLLRLDATMGTGERRMPDGTTGREFQIEVSTATGVQGVILE